MLENITFVSTAENLGAGPCPDPNQDNVGGNILLYKVSEEKEIKKPQNSQKQSPFLGRDDVSESSMGLGYSWNMHSDAATLKCSQVLQFNLSL